MVLEVLDLRFLMFSDIQLRFVFLEEKRGSRVCLFLWLCWVLVFYERVFERVVGVTA